MKRIFHAVYDIDLFFNPDEDGTYHEELVAALALPVRQRHKWMLTRFPILKEIDVYYAAPEPLGRRSPRAAGSIRTARAVVDFAASGYFVGDWDPVAYEQSLITGEGPPALDYAKDNWESIIQDVDLAALRALPEASIQPTWLVLEVFDMAVPTNWRVALRLIGNKHGTVIADEEMS